MGKRRLAVLATCFCIVFTAYAIRYGYGVLLPEMLPSLAISMAEAGLIYSSFFVAYTIFSPVFGLLGDRYDMRFLLALFVAIFGTGTLLMAYASSILQASLFFGLAGMGSAACWAPVMALAQRWSSDKHRGKTLALVDVGSSLGIVTIGAGMPWLVSAYDWRAGWLCLGTLALAVAVLSLIAVRNSPNNMPHRNQESSQHFDQAIMKTYGRLLKDQRFWLIGLAYLFTGFSIIIPFTFLNTYAVRELELSFEVGAMLLTVVGIGAMAGKLILGPISDRTGRIRIMMLCAALVATGSLGMAYGHVVILFIFTGIFSLGYGALWSMYAASASDYFSKDSSGSIVGLWTVYLGIGSITAPIIAGWLADTTATLAWSFILGAGGGVLSFLLLVPVWRKPLKPAPAGD